MWFKSVKILFISLLFWAIGCSKMPDIPTLAYDFKDVPVCLIFKTGQKTGQIKGNFATELSGIAASRSFLGKYWVHIDGSKASEIYLIDSLGNRLSTLDLPGISPNDCEDLAVGFDSISGFWCIFLADIGDNNGNFKTHFIYKIPEPTILGSMIPTKLTASGIEKWPFNYPNNQKWNAETLLFDPISHDFLILTKNNQAGALFRFPFPQSSTTTTTLERVIDLPIDLATAGDISPDGTEILLKNKKEIFYWKAKNGEKPADLLKNNDPERVPYVAETQGEAICFNVWATGFLTTSELANANSQPIYFYLKY